MRLLQKIYFRWWFLFFDETKTWYLFCCWTFLLWLDVFFENRNNDWRFFLIHQLIYLVLHGFCSLTVQNFLLDSLKTPLFCLFILEFPLRSSPVTSFFWIFNLLLYSPTFSQRLFYVHIFCVHFPLNILFLYFKFSFFS